MALSPSTAPIGTLPSRDRVMADILELRSRRDYTPLKLRPAMENLHRIHRAEDAQALDHCLQELVVSALATMERIRTACPDVGGPAA